MDDRPFRASGSLSPESARAASARPSERRRQGPAALLVNRSILVFSFGGGTIGHDGGIPVDADFDLIRDERIEIHTAGLAILQVLRAGLDVPVRAIMDVVLGQDRSRKAMSGLTIAALRSLTSFVNSRSSLAVSPTAQPEAASNENRDCK